MSTGLSVGLDLELGSVVVLREGGRLSAYKYVGIEDGTTLWATIMDEEFVSVEDTPEVRASILSVFRPSEHSEVAVPQSDLATSLGLPDGTIIVTVAEDTFPQSYTYYEGRGWLADGDEEFAHIEDTPEVRASILSVFRPTDRWSEPEDAG